MKTNLGEKIVFTFQLIAFLFMIAGTVITISGIIETFKGNSKAIPALILGIALAVSAGLWFKNLILPEKGKDE